MELLARVRDHLRSLALPPGRVLVAVSGGPDSVALLDLLHQTRDVHRLDPVVGHVDHGIHPASGAAARAVADLAERLGMPCFVERAALGPGTSETRAREARYRLLFGLADRLGIDPVLTAHHADDQVETVLLRFLGGSGPAGLAGMAPLTGRLIRPLLPFRRDELALYVETRGLTVWHDPSNRDRAHLRSWLRADLLPMLRERVPAVDARLERVGALAARDRRAWDQLLDQLPGLDPRVEQDGISVAANRLRAYDSTLAEALLLALARRAGCPLGPGRAGRVLALLAGSSGRLVPLGQGWRAELAFERLRLVPPSSPIRPDKLDLRGAEGDSGWGGWRLRWRTEAAPDRQAREALTAWFRPEPLQVRAWVAGDRVQPLAGAGRRLVVRCFQDARVPRSSRAGWPVITGGESVVWVPGVCRSDALLPSPGAEALRVDAEHA
jgi:tRNA(Ile)-lysidine synthase